MKSIFAIVPLVLSMYSIAQDTTYTLQGDALFTNAGFSFYKGQTLVAGKGSDKNGWYRSIGFKGAIQLPILVNHNSDMKNYYNGSDREEISTRDQVKRSLYPGTNKLKVYKVKRDGNKKLGYWYVIYLKNEEFPGTKYICTVEKAVRTGEIMLDGQVSSLSK